MWTSTFVSLLLAGEAHAAACCVGRTSAQAAWLSPCEHYGVGLSTSVGADLLRWRGDGGVDTSSLTAYDGELSLVGGVRFDRRWQMGAFVPFRGAWRSAGETAAWGGGLGDPGLSARWDPIEEQVAVEGRGAPVPAFMASVSVPLGTDDGASEAELMADVTGSGAFIATMSGGLGRSSDRVPWWVGAGAVGELGDGRRGVGFDVSGMVGWSVTSNWTLSSSASHREMWRGVEQPEARSAETRAGLSVAYGAPLRFRLWLGVDSGLPIPGAGVDLPLSTKVNGGLLILR